MDIQQKEKESLAAYIHQFKAETKRCNFTNDAAMIRILTKGLKYTHGLAVHIFEQGHKNTHECHLRSGEAECHTAVDGNNHPTLHS